jgi:hypothetical protein
MNKQEEKCAEKVPYRTADEARAVIAFNTWRHGSSNQGVYQCPICRRWHIYNKTGA